MMVQMRAGEASDADALVPLILALGFDTDEAHVRRRVERLASDSSHALLVAVDDPHGVVAFVHIAVAISMIAPPRAEIRALCVAATHRRQGIGRQLVEASAAWASRRGIDDVWLLGEPHRHGLDAFSAALGYQPVADARAYARDAPDVPSDPPTKMD